MSLNLPPKICIPSSEKMTMNKNSKSNNETIERKEFNNDVTSARSEFQYL